MHKMSKVNEFYKIEREQWPKNARKQEDLWWNGGRRQEKLMRNRVPGRVDRSE